MYKYQNKKIISCATEKNVSTPTCEPPPPPSPPSPLLLSSHERTTTNTHHDDDNLHIPIAPGHAHYTWEHCYMILLLQPIYTGRAI